MEYTLADAAKVARVNRSTLFRAIKKGNLSARRLEDGTFRVDASELARVYDLQHIARNEVDVVHDDAQGEVDAATPATASDPGGEATLLRFRLQRLEADLAHERKDRERERQDRDREREHMLENVEDLRKRLDTEQAERRSLQLRLMPPEKPVEPDRSQEVVEDLRKRLEDTEGRMAAVEAMERVQERAGEGAGKKAPKGFLRRLWGG